MTELAAYGPFYEVYTGLGTIDGHQCNNVLTGPGIESLIQDNFNEDPENNMFLNCTFIKVTYVNVLGVGMIPTRQIWLPS